MRVDILVKSGGNWIKTIGSLMRSEIKSMHDLIHITQGDARFLETIGDGADGKVTGMLFSTEALLGCSGNQLTVNKQCSRRIMTLGNAIFAFLQVWPVGLLERHGPFETADSENNQRSSSPIPGFASTSARVGLFAGPISTLKRMRVF